MAEKPETHELPQTGGSYTRSPTTGKLTRTEEPTVQEPGAVTSAMAPEEPAATPEGTASAKKAKET